MTQRDLTQDTALRATVQKLLAMSDYYAVARDLRDYGVPHDVAYHLIFGKWPPPLTKNNISFN